MADRLGKTIEEIEQISIEHYNEWIAYFNISEEKQKIAHKKMHKM